MTQSERKQLQAETLLEVVKGLGDVAPEVGMVSYSFAKLAERLAKRAGELISEASQLAARF